VWPHGLAVRYPDADLRVAPVVAVVLGVAVLAVTVALVRWRRRAPLAAFTLGRMLLMELANPTEAAGAFAEARRLSPHGPLAEAALAKAKLPQNMVIDCSHANSYKKPELQPLVMQDCINQICAQRKAGHRSIVGLMIESFIEAENQPIPVDLSQLRYGCSVTDACVDWPTTEKMIRDADAALRSVLANSNPA